LIARPDPDVVELVVVVPVVVVEVLPVALDRRLAAEVRSISAPRPRTTPASWVTAVLVPNGSDSDKVTEQSELTL
jgi:hypothetical protein